MYIYTHIFVSWLSLAQNLLKKPWECSPQIPISGAVVNFHKLETGCPFSWKNRMTILWGLELGMPYASILSHSR